MNSVLSTIRRQSRYYDSSPREEKTQSGLAHHLPHSRTLTWSRAPETHCKGFLGRVIPSRLIINNKAAGITDHDPPI